MTVIAFHDFANSADWQEKLQSYLGGFTLVDLMTEEGRLADIALVWAPPPGRFAEMPHLKGIINKGQGDKKEKRPKFVKSHTICVVRIKLSRKICVEKFADVAQLGQFTLRDEKQTIAVGRVLKILK